MLCVVRRALRAYAVFVTNQHLTWVGDSIPLRYHTTSDERQKTEPSFRCACGRCAIDNEAAICIE